MLGPLTGGRSSRVSRAVEFQRNRIGPGSEAVQGRVVLVRQHQPDIPVPCTLGSSLREEIVVADDSLLLVLLVDRLEVLTDVSPELRCVPRFDIDKVDPADRTLREILLTRQRCAGNEKEHCADEYGQFLHDDSFQFERAALLRQADGIVKALPARSAGYSPGRPNVRSAGA